MRLELVGLPGAGKSTVARKLERLGKYQRVRITSKAELLLYSSQFLIVHPIAFSRLFFLYARHARGPYLKQKWVSAFLGYNAKYMKARQYPYAILDQGHLQTLMSLFDAPIDETHLAKIIKFLPKADHYIFFTVAESVRQERLNQRPNLPRPLLSESERTQWQSAAKQHYQFLLTRTDLLGSATYEKYDEGVDTERYCEVLSKATFMRYVTFARMPTEKAHGLQIAKMCEAFTLRGVRLALVTPRRSNPISESVADYYQLKASFQHHYTSTSDVTSWFTPARGWQHYLHLMLFSFQVLFLPLPKEIIVYTRTDVVAWVSRLRGRTMVCEEHYWPERGSWLHTQFIKRANLIVCNSEGTAAACLEHGLTHTLVAHNGFDESMLNVTMNQAEARQQLGLPLHKKIIMYIGSLQDWKGVDTLSEAAEQLEENYCVVVIGGGAAEVSRWREKYPKVQFLGERPYHELGSNQIAPDVLVVPNKPISKSSTQYTSPIKLFAHLASGVPLVVSDLPAMRSVVTEEMVTFFTPGDTTSLVSAIHTVLANENHSRAKAEAAKLVAASYTWPARAQNILKSLSKVVTINNNR